MHTQTSNTPSIPLTLAEKARQAREFCADPHRFYKAFSRTARRFQHMNRSARLRVMTLVGTAEDFLPRRVLKLALFERVFRVTSWDDVLAYIVRELVAAKPAEIRALSRAGLLPWMTSADPTLDLVAAFSAGQASINFTTREEAFQSVQWLLIMCDVRLNEVVVQIDPYESNAAWRARETEIREKRTEENRVLREIDEARRRYAAEHPEDEMAQRIAEGHRPPKKEEPTWEL